MARNQSIHDGGSIIGYEPTLEYQKDANNTTEKQAELSAKKAQASEPIIYSSTLRNFIDSSPSYTLQMLSTTSEYLQKIIEKLCSAFPNKTHDEYGVIEAYLTALACGDDEFAMEFVNWHKHDMNGSQIPELIDCVYCGKHRIDTISDTVKQLYYGNSNLALLDAKEIDEAYISKMRVYENAGSRRKINYYALAMDTELDRVILTHTAGVRKSATQISIITKKVSDSQVHSENVDLIKSLYDEVNFELDSRFRTFNSQQSVDIVEKALYNYYQKRRATMGVYTLLSDSSTSALFDKRLREKQQDTQEAIENVGRSLRAYELYTSKFTELEREKHFLKDVYASLNYNSNK